MHRASWIFPYLHVSGSRLLDIYRATAVPVLLVRPGRLHPVWFDYFCLSRKRRAYNIAASVVAAFTNFDKRQPLHIVQV